MSADLIIRPITLSRFRDVEALFGTDSIMRSCWDIWPRYVGKEHAAIEARHGTTGYYEAEGEVAGRSHVAKRSATTYTETNRLELRRLAGRRRAPGLIAYDGREPVGFVSLGPRTEMRRTDASRTTPRVDELPVWVVPCFFVRKDHRGRGVTVALLKAAVAYAAKHGAPAVEGYPRASRTRVHESTAFFGTAAQFRRAGFRRVGRPRRDLPKGWVPRCTMRATCS